MTAKTDPARLDDAIRSYLAGQSAYEIAATTGVGRGALKRELLARGIKPRDRSGAGKVRASKMTKAERMMQAEAAHAAAKGRHHTIEERHRRALTRESRPPEMSSHEAQIAKWLDDLGIEHRREVAVGPYNVDFAVGAVAVEILGGEWHAYKTARHAQRTPYILDQGWTMAFVWATPMFPLDRIVAEQIVSLADETRRDPSSLGQYRVIRGDGHLIAAGELENGKVPEMPPARHGLDRSEVGRLGAAARWDGNG